VTIAHRLTTIIDSDAIAVIANGKISELGNHETLLNKEGGIYRLLCESQGIKPGEEIDALLTIGRKMSRELQKEKEMWRMGDPLKTKLQRQLLLLGYKWGRQTLPKPKRV